MRPSFIYYLFNKDRQPLYVDDNNHVLTGDAGNYFKPDGQPARLKHAPDGWKDTLVKYARNIKYWGLFRDYSVPMNFVGDGRRILRDQFYKYGAEATVYLGIAKLDRASVPYNYTSWYISELDFTKYEETKTGVKVMAVEGGLTKFIKSNENTVYEIPIDTDPEQVFVKHDGVVLTNKANYNFVDTDEINNSDHGGFWLLDFIFRNQESTTPFVTFQTQTFIENNVGYSTKLLSDNWFARAGVGNLDPIDLRIQGRIGIHCTQQDAANGISVRFLRSNLDIANQNDYQIIFESPLVADEIYYYDIDVTIPLEPGERAYLETFIGTTGVTTAYEFREDSQLSISYNGRARTTYIAGLYPYRVLEVLLNTMTGGLYTLNSPWLEALTDIILTSGNSVRGIRYIDTLVPNKIKTSLADFFQWLKSTYSVGLTVVNDKLVIDQLSEFFTANITADLGEVDNIVITHAEDLAFNTIKVGYKPQEYNDVNGKYEFNLGQQWTTPKTRDVKELDLVSPFRADPIGTELLRINYEGLTTTDAKDDNEVFVFNVEEVSQTITQTVDFFASGNYMTNPGNYPFAAGNVVRITGSTSNNLDFVVVGTGVNIVQFDTPVVVTDETAAAITITFLQGGIFELYRPAFSAMSGIPTAMEDSIYNVLLSPHTMLLNNGPLIHSVLDLMEDKSIKLASADQNAELSYTLAGVTVTENEDIQIGNLGAQLFKPYYLTLRTKVPLNVIELINADPFGQIQHTVYDEDYFGFLWDGGIAPAKAGKDNDAQNWKLLAAPENILKNIYDY